MGTGLGDQMRSSGIQVLLTPPIPWMTGRYLAYGYVHVCLWVFEGTDSFWFKRKPKEQRMFLGKVPIFPHMPTYN